MKKYYKFEMDMQIMNAVSLVSSILSILLLVILGGSKYSKLFGSNYFGLFFAGLIFYFFLHEFFHGIGYFLFAKNKKNIKFGIMLDKGVFYAMCQEELSKKQILISLFMPIVFLSIIPIIVSLVFDLPWLMFYAIFNLNGAIGDIFMAILVFKLPSDIRYIDYDNVLGAYFLSKKDLSKYKSFGLNFIESGRNTKSMINKKIKRFYVSEKSIPMLVIIAIIIILNIVITNL